MSSAIPISNTSRSMQPSPLPSPSRQSLLVYLFATFVVVFVVHAAWGSRRNKSAPLVNPRKLFDFTGSALKAEFSRRSYDIINNQGRTHPYTLNTDMGPLIVLPASYGDEIKNNPNLNLLDVLDSVSMQRLGASYIPSQHSQRSRCSPASLAFRGSGPTMRS